MNPSQVRRATKREAASPRLTRPQPKRRRIPAPPQQRNAKKGSKLFGMNAERIRDYLLSLPHVVEAEQWGGLLYWVGDKAIGGKTFAMVNLEATGGLPISFSAGPERFAELVEQEGIQPAPYSAKNFWVAAEGWDAFPDREWQDELTAAHATVYAKLPPKTKQLLAMSKIALKRVVAERRKLLTERAADKSKA